MGMHPKKSHGRIHFKETQRISAEEFSFVNKSPSTESVLLTPGIGFTVKVWKIGKIYHVEWVNL